MADQPGSQPRHLRLKNLGQHLHAPEGKLCCGLSTDFYWASNPFPPSAYCNTSEAECGRFFKHDYFARIPAVGDPLFFFNVPVHHLSLVNMYVRIWLCSICSLKLLVSLTRCISVHFILCNANQAR